MPGSAHFLACAARARRQTRSRPRPRPRRAASGAHTGGGEKKRDKFIDIRLSRRARERKHGNNKVLRT